MCDILVDHDAVQNLAVLNLASGNLLDAGITLDVDLLLASHLSGHCANSLECKTAHQLRPPRDKLCANGRADDSVHFLIVVHVDVGRNLVNDLERIGQGLLESLDDNDGVDVAFELGQGLCKDFTSCRRLAIFMLSPPDQTYPG